MRARFWRRFAATLALVLGIGVAAPAAQATATPAAGQTSVQATTLSVQNDWWW